MRTMHDGPARRAHRRLSRGRVLAGPPQGHRRPHRRAPRAHDDPRRPQQHVPWMKRHGVRFQPPLGGTLHAVAHQRVLPRRRQGAAERLLPRGRGARRRRRLRHRGRRPRRSTDGRFARPRSMRAARAHVIRAKAMVAACGRLRVQPRVAARSLGPAGRQLHRARHALQHGPRAQAAARRGREVRSSDADAGPLRGDRRALARSSTAAS